MFLLVSTLLVLVLSGQLDAYDSLTVSVVPIATLSQRKDGEVSYGKHVDRRG